MISPGKTNVVIHGPTSLRCGLVHGKFSGTIVIHVVTLLKLLERRILVLDVYKSYIRPVLEYGAPVILGASETYIKKLQIIQNKAIRIAYKLDPLSHTEDIHNIAKIDLIKDRFQILTYKFIDSLKEHSDLFKLQNEFN